MESNCIYCSTRLIPHGHWGLCPKCEGKYIKAVTPPRFQEAFTPEWLNLDKGRPWRNGQPS